MTREERQLKYARAIWSAMVDDEPPEEPHPLLWEGGYLDAADAVIALFDQERERHA